MVPLYDPSSLAPWELALVHELSVTLAYAPWLKLVHYPKTTYTDFGTLYPGLYLTRTEAPCPLPAPTLFILPPPYHPIEVMLTNRGWGGTISTVGEYKGIQEISEHRGREWRAVLKGTGEVLGLSPFEVARTYSVFTPFLVNCNEALKPLEESCSRIWRALDQTPSLYYDTLSVTSRPYLRDFWELSDERPSTGRRGG